MKQTAVEYLLEELPKGYFDHQQMVIKQAKEMEKQQIIDAYNSGQQEEAKDLFWTKGSEYYEETFNI